ncbi:MAG TPA: type I-D CRISPR-associated protein Cas7/Csc2 [Candidatus Competibacteraceae bacterium]|nr:type I-D CRISPR-associated protein Cas7/Csc2 [Candidatus Competibacteraceae bacterium]HRZ07050.1 type I-D CRISPR-associated protein Cas7/Csc2 [Candidatus Competibacteraceae bacterium]
MTLNDLYSLLPTDVAQTLQLKDETTIPKLPEAQVIVIPLVREAVAPMLIRNNDVDDITDMPLAGKNRVLMIASKTKGVERRNGARILRTLGVGGRFPTNKTYIREDNIRDAYDLNTYVFGDSAKSAGGGSAIYSVHSAVLYSDAVSVQSRAESVMDQFRQGGISEDGGAFDVETKSASSNIFTTRYVIPGTLFIQTLVMTGRRMTATALDHLLLAIGLSGAYGGQTAVTGTNLRTHLAGIYWGRLERPVNAPKILLEQLAETRNAAEIRAGLEILFGQVYPGHCDSETLSGHLAGLVERFEQDDPELRQWYQAAKQQMADLFASWFVGNKEKKSAKAGRKG